MPLIKEKQKINTEVVVGFECNKCKVFYQKNDILEFQEMIHIHDIGGFSSRWGDGIEFSLTICSQCSVEMFSDIADIINE